MTLAPVTVRWRQSWLLGRETSIDVYAGHRGIKASEITRDRSFTIPRYEGEFPWGSV